MSTQSGLALVCLGLLLASCTPVALEPCSPACAAGTHCDGAACVADAPEDSGVTVDLAVSVNADLVMGCMPACTNGKHCNANRQCVLCITDEHCPFGQVCKTSAGNAICVPGCADDSRCGQAQSDGGALVMKCCTGQCIDSSSDTSNCGACNKTCTAPNAVATCKAGSCAPGACNAGWADCNMDPKDGCETNLHVDPANCGKCGGACKLANAISGCSNGCYVRACNYGYDNCNGVDTDGCEVPVLADPKNCGSCGSACKVPPHGKAGCQLGSCVLTSCDSGFFDCDGVAVNGCEVAIVNDTNNCGACGNVCPMGLACKNNSCTCPQCNIPNSKTKCINNMCMFDGCLAGYGDCDNNTNNGCEKDLSMDKANCGGCGIVCPMGQPFCFNNACQAMLPGTLLGVVNGQSYYKVQVMGLMTDTNIFAACQGSGFNTPCQATQGCQYNDKVCVMTQETSCGNPMQILAQTICKGGNPPSCAPLDGCYQYMGHTWQNDSGCGADAGQWCSIGNTKMNRFAICVP